MTKFGKIFYLFFLIIAFFYPFEQSFSQVTNTEANYNFEIGNFDIALKQYLKLYKKDKENPLYNYCIGVCYLNTDINKPLAIPYLEFALKHEKTEKLVLFDLARAYYYAHWIDKAIQTFNEYKELMKDNPELVSLTDRLIEICLNTRELIRSPVNVIFINLGKNINSKRADYNPFVTDDETFLYYTSNKRYLSEFQKLDNNIYVSKSHSGKWTKCKSIGSKINNDEDQILAGMSIQGDMLFVQQINNFSYPNIFVSKKIKNKFMELKKVGENINSKKNVEAASLSANQDTLYFAGDRPGGYGGLDIYFSLKLPNGQWALPQNLGPAVNTQYDENYPNISKDGNTLYFSSKGHNTMGGYDIFISKRNSKTNKWSKPGNIGYPINTTSDNYNISFCKNKRYAYIAATRKEGFGNLDIYKVIFKKVEPDNIIIKGIIAVGDSLFSIPIKKYDPEISITVRQLTDKKTEKLFGKYSYKRSTGEYIISLPPGKYNLIIEGDSYITYQKIIEIPETQPENKEIIQNIYLKKKLKNG